MKTTSSLSVAAVAVALAVGGMVSPPLFGASPALAADAKKTVSNKLGKQFQEAQSLVSQKNYKGALTKIDELKAAPGKTAYENFVIAELQTAAYVGTQDYTNAAKAMEAALDSGEAPAASKQQRAKNIANTYFAAKNMAKFNEASAKYQKDFGADIDLQLLAAQGLFQDGKYKEAAQAARTVISTAEAKGQPAKEDWLKLVYAAENKAGNAAAEKAAVEALVARYPKPEYWNALLINAQKTIKGPKVQLEIYRIMLAAGVMQKTEEYMDMAQLSIQAGVPAEAEKVIQKGQAAKLLMEGPQKDRHLRLQNMALTQIKEKDAALAQQEADAKAAATGDADVQVGEVFASKGQTDKAIEAIQRGIKKGVKDKDDANLRLGVVYLSAGKRTEANNAFKAITPNSSSAQIARLWTLLGTNAVAAAAAPVPAAKAAPAKKTAGK